MKVTLDTIYTKQVLGVVLNSRYVGTLLLSQKSINELFSLKPGEACEVGKNTLNALFALLAEISDDGILWQVDEEEENTVYKLQLSDGGKWRRDLNNHLALALNLSKLPKLWEREK